MQQDPISSSRLAALLSVQDLTQVPGHAIAQMAERIGLCLENQSTIERVSGPPIVLADYNYKLLGYPEDSIVQAGTYTEWVDYKQILRTQTTSLILQALIDLSPSPSSSTLIAPGMVYRRDVRDRWHCAQPHQMDIWVLMPKEDESPSALHDLVSRICAACIPDAKIDIQQTEHPYTCVGIEISAHWQDQWLEIGEAGLIDPALLDRLGVDSKKWGGLAMGVGLDRLVMVKKDLPDIRLLRDDLPGVQNQMRNLDPWKPVSRQPIAKREISIARQKGEIDEAITEDVLLLMGEDGQWLQSLEIIGRWDHADIHPAARERLGITEGQENLLLRLTWQSESASLDRGVINEIMRALYRGLHQGTGWEYCP